jgi:hypothetical protein
MAPGNLLIADAGSMFEIFTSPLLGFSKPHKISTNVVFPAPEGPTIAKTLPGSISKSKELIAFSFFEG